MSDNGTKGPRSFDVSKWAICCGRVSSLLAAVFTAGKPKGWFTISMQTLQEHKVMPRLLFQQFTVQRHEMCLNSTDGFKKQKLVPPDTGLLR